MFDWAPPGPDVVPQMLRLTFGAPMALDSRAGLRPIDDLDVMYRVASGTYGTSYRRPDRPWPLARPYIVGLRFGSPFEVSALVDLNTVLAGASGIGLFGLIKYIWGFDLDLRNRRHAARARGEQLLADAAEARVRRAKALAQARSYERGAHVYVPDREERALSRASVPASPVGLPEDPGERDELISVIEEAVRILPERSQSSARNRLLDMCRRPSVDRGFASGSMREPTDDERERLLHVGEDSSRQVR